MFPDFTKSKYNEVNMNNSNDDLYTQEEEFTGRAWLVAFAIIVIAVIAGVYAVSSNKQRIAEQKVVEQQKIVELNNQSDNVRVANNAAQNQNDFQSWERSWSAKASGKFGYDPLENVALRDPVVVKQDIETTISVYNNRKAELTFALAKEANPYRRVQLQQYLIEIKKQAESHIFMCNLEFLRYNYIYNHVAPWGY